MGSIDDRTFGVNFTVDGVAKLRDRVKDKLKEYMGDYTDDTLVEYVIVLLRNGRRKDESKNELNVFLGDDSDSFISWLWDHLASHLDAYVQPQDEVSKPKSHPDQSGKIASHHLDSEPDRRKSNYESRSRHNKEWKGLARDAAEPPPLRSSEIEDIHLDAKVHHEISIARRSLSLLSAAHRKRNWPDEQPCAKREININAPRRLLQFAVRDAVATSKPTNSAAEPPLKRLRSVVSTGSGESTLVECPRRIQSVARVPNPTATVIKAVAEAAEDVSRFRLSGSVFDRLGRGMDVSETSVQLASFRDPADEDSEYKDASQIHERMRLAYIQQDDQSKKYVGNSSLLESETGLASDSISENEGFDDINTYGRRVTDASEIATTVGNKAERSVISRYSLAKIADEVRHGATANASHKIVNISVHVNAWKPPHYQEVREVGEVDGLKSVQEHESRASKSFVRVMENSSVIAVSNGNAKHGSDSQKESQKTHLSVTGHYASGCPLEDADSRTLFVSNVHFAATKDSLSRHFNKFGEVLKVVIVTDATSRQPIGSAYVEFMRKEAADTALSLDGTSFMSRMLKVVRRSAAQQEAASTVTWPRNARGATFSIVGFPRPFARGFSGPFRPQPPIKIGARSLQWKRDSRASSVEINTSLPGNLVPSPTARSLTYVRTEAKPEANCSTN